MSEVFDKAVEEAMGSVKIPLGGRGIPSAMGSGTKEGLTGLGERLYSEYEKLPWYKQLLLDVAPGTGETISAYEAPIFAEKTKEAYEKGDLLATAGHGALTGLSALGAIPFLGAGIRGVKAGVKGVKKGLSEMDFSLSPTDQPVKLRKFVDKEIKKLFGTETKNIVKHKDGLPVLLYHSTKGRDPFKEFEWSKKGKEAEIERERGLRSKPGGGGDIPDYNDFLSTTTNKESRFIERSSGHRTLIGVGKVKKLFNFTNKIHVKSVINPLVEKELELFKKRFPEIEKNMKYDFSRKGILEKNPQAKAADLEAHIKSQEDYLRSEIKYGMLNKGKELRKIIDRWSRVTKDMEAGRWQVLENENIKDKIRELGYDAFTTSEDGINVMLFNPNKQFIPLFDPLKQNPLGFKHGGEITGGLSSLNE